MKKEVAELWVKALRSGDYRQGFGRLRTPEDNYCCLGVLCDISPIPMEMNLSNSLPVIEVVKWAGLSSDNPRISDGRALTTLNDAAGLSFNQIVDFIEKEWETL